jgi:hypothetical protein
MIKCEYCGKFISYQSIDNNSAIVTDEGNCSLGCPCLDVKYSHVSCSLLDFENE